MLYFFYLWNPVLPETLTVTWYPCSNPGPYHQFHINMWSKCIVVVLAFFSTVQSEKTWDPYNLSVQKSGTVYYLFDYKKKYLEGAKHTRCLLNLMITSSITKWIGKWSTNWKPKRQRSIFQSCQHALMERFGRWWRKRRKTIRNLFPKTRIAWKTYANYDQASRLFGWWNVQKSGWSVLWHHVFIGTLWFVWEHREIIDLKSCDIIFYFTKRIIFIR